MSDKELIKQEIERLHELLPVVDCDNVSINYAENICLALEKYIDSLPEEHNEDLEEEIDRYYSDWQFDDDTIYEDMRKICRHFAEWGRNHFEDKSEMVSENLEGRSINALKSFDATMTVVDKHRPFELSDFVKESFIPD